MDNDSRIKGLIRFIFSYIIETGGEIREEDKLIESLAEEGYSKEEIESAILWVSLILEKSVYMERDEFVSELDTINTTFVRPLNSEEREKLTPQVQGLLYWLTSTGQLSPQDREDILDLIYYIDENITKDMFFSILDTLVIDKEQGEKDLLYQRYYN